MRTDRLSRRDINTQLELIGIYSDLQIDVERTDFQGYKQYQVYTLSGTRFFDTIKEVLSFLEGYRLAILLKDKI